jgi:hypothetical protein
MNYSLTLHAYMHAHGVNLNENRKAIAYRVNGLPVAEQAWIAHFRRGWRLLRSTAGVQGGWTGQYSGPDEALAALQLTVSDVR